jgi:hypothetical protein
MAKENQCHMNITFLSFQIWAPAGCGHSTRELFEVDVAIPILIEGIEQGLNQD